MSAIPWIANVGEAAAETWKVDLENTVCISIVDPAREDEARLPAFKAVLRFKFHDFDSGRKHPEFAVLYDRKMAAKVARFVRKHRGCNILVHCAAGISRSGGMVEALLQALPEYMDRGWQRFPNIHVKVLTLRAMGVVPLSYDEARYQPQPNPAIRFIEGSNDPIVVEDKDG